MKYIPSFLHVPTGTVDRHTIIDELFISLTTEETIPVKQSPFLSMGVGTEMKMTSQEDRSFNTTPFGMHNEGSLSYTTHSISLHANNAVAFPTKPFPTIPSFIYTLKLHKQIKYKNDTNWLVG